MSGNSDTLMLLLGCTVIMSACSRQVSYQEEVLPILQTSCYGCHISGEGAEHSGLIMDSYEHLMHGTKLGPVVVPGSSASSTLYLVVSGNVDPKIQMPPHHEDRLAEGLGTPLNDKQIETIKLWIDQGAKNN